MGISDFFITHGEDQSFICYQEATKDLECSEELFEIIHLIYYHHSSHHRSKVWRVVIIEDKVFDDTWYFQDKLT